MKTPPEPQSLDLELAPEHLLAIGTLAARWALLELVTEWSISFYRKMTIGDSRKGLPKDFSKRATKLQAIAGDHLKGPDRRALIQLCERATIAARQRNLAIHGYWVPDIDRKEPVCLSWYHTKDGAPWERMYARDLPDLIRETRDITNGMLTLLVRNGARPPSPDTQP